jgi:hypothetical protein
MLGYGVEQTVLVAEQPVDHRSLDARALSDTPRGDSRGTLLLEEARRDLDDSRARVQPVLYPCVVSHIPTIRHHRYQCISRDTI